MLVTLSIATFVLAFLAIVGWIFYTVERDEKKRYLKELTKWRTTAPNYEWATLEDRIAIAAMQTLLDGFRPGALNMDVEKVADESYRIAKFMLQARAFRKV
jgi:hypothetical protein